MEMAHSFSWFGTFLFIPIGFIGIAIPLAALYVIYLIYQKLNRIEKLLSQRNE